ncbi:MAG: PorV/PorQ family protein [Elusimicrobiota bacterium]
MNYNPAILATISAFHISMLYDNAFDDAGIYYLGMGKSFKSVSIALTATTYQGGKITINDRGDELHDKTLTAQTDYVFSLFIAKKLFNRLYCGITPKLYSSTLVEEFSASATAFDAGIFYKTGLFKMGKEKMTKKMYSGGINLGGSVKNLGGKVTYNTIADPLPLVMRAGLLYPLRFNAQNCLQILAEGIKANEDDDIKAGTGFEYIYSDMFFARFGYAVNYNIKNFSWGMGMKYSWFQLDYGMILNSAINSRHQLLLSVSPQKSKGKKIRTKAIKKAKIKTKKKTIKEPEKKTKEKPKKKSWEKI